MLFFQSFSSKFLTALEKRLRGNCYLCNINIFPYTFFVDTQVQQMASSALKTNSNDLKKMILLWFENKRLLPSFFWSTCMLFFSVIKLVYYSSWKETEGQLLIMQHKSIHLHPFCWYTMTAHSFLCFEDKQEWLEKDNFIVV